MTENRAEQEALPGSGFDLVAMLNSVHIPEDAGEHAEGLLRILERIPDGWGRWIGCGPGWYPIIVRLADEIAELLPAYEIHQVKEKYGTLRFYWGAPHREPACCEAFRERDPRPFEGAISGPLAPKDRDPEELRLLEEWFVRYQEHAASEEHRRVNSAEVSVLDRKRAEELGRKIEALIDAAEDVSARTCEYCGALGALHENTGWFATLCPSHAAERGYVPQH